MRGSVARRWVVAVVGVLVALVGRSMLASGVGGAGTTADGDGSSGRPGRVVGAADVARAVERTIAAGSARLEGRYEPATGPPVVLAGRVSFRGPDAEVAAAVDGEGASHVRVTPAGAWVRPPGVDGWTSVPLGAGGGAVVPARGWAEVLHELRPGDDVWVDGDGRIAHVRLSRDGRGGVLDVRFTDYGIEVVTVPP